MSEEPKNDIIKPQRTVYDKKLLDEILARDGATLVGDYEKLNSEITIYFKCKCGNSNNKIFRSFVKWGGVFCKQCTQLKQRDKACKTFMDKYGVSNPQKNKDIREKVIRTCIDKYGKKCSFQSSDVKEKIKATNILKYGVKSPLQNEDILNKVKSTNIIKYGVINPQQNKDIRAKVIKTNIKKYGVECSLKNPDVQNKIKNTLQDKYGVTHNFQAGDLRDKMKETFIEKYGVEYPAQNQEIFEKAQKNAKRLKEFTMPSGAVRKVQGYEPFALNELLQTYTEDQIKTGRQDIPRIKYTHNGKERYYFPDIFIPHENKIIEVKSTWTAKCKADCVNEKGIATKAAGYSYELWVYNGKGVKQSPDS